MTHVTHVLCDVIPNVRHVTYVGKNRNRQKRVIAPLLERHIILLLPKQRLRSIDVKLVTKTSLSVNYSLNISLVWHMLKK